MQSKGADDKLTKVRDLRPFMKNITCVFILLEKGAVTKTKDQHEILHVLVADGTGAIHLSLWDVGRDQVQCGDILKLTQGYCTLYKKSLVLYSGRYGTLEKLGEFNMAYTERPNMSLAQWVPDSEAQAAQAAQTAVLKPIHPQPIAK